jgi:hypothetical protein
LQALLQYLGSSFYTSIKGSPSTGLSTPIFLDEDDRQSYQIRFLKQSTELPSLAVTLTIAARHHSEGGENPWIVLVWFFAG